MRKASGEIFQLNVSIGQLTEIAESEEKFRALADTQEKRRQWFAEEDELAAARQGLRPDQHQCIGFKIPLVFAESGRPGNAYVADLYEHVSFLGDIHRQIAELPEGAKIKLEVK